MQLQQIRGVLPRAVTVRSSRYPQLLCNLIGFFRRTHMRTTVRVARAMLNDVSTRAAFINLKPRFGLCRRGEVPLSGADALSP
jgi:hypothetical protein